MKKQGDWSQNTYIQNMKMHELIQLKKKKEEQEYESNSRLITTTNTNTNTPLEGVVPTSSDNVSSFIKSTNTVKIDDNSINLNKDDFKKLQMNLSNKLCNFNSNIQIFQEDMSLTSSLAKPRNNNFSNIITERTSLTLGESRNLMQNLYNLKNYNDNESISECSEAGSDLFSQTSKSEQLITKNVEEEEEILYKPR